MLTLGFCSTKRNQSMQGKGRSSIRRFEVFPKLQRSKLPPQPLLCPGQIRVWVEDTQLVRAHKNSAGTPSHSGYYWPQDSRKLCVNWEECVRIVKTEVTEPKIPHSICDVALKIITTNTKDDKEPPHHSKHCWHLISYFSLLGKKENQPLVF